MRPATSSLARLARPAPSLNVCPRAAARAASTQAGPSTPPTPPRQKRLPKAVLRDLVNLHHRSSTFMHDPSQLTDAFSVAFRTAPPERINYDEFRRSVISDGASSRFSDAMQYDKPEASFGRGADEDLKWSDRGAQDLADEHMTERDKLVREALFGTHERGPGEQVRPGLEGVEEWLSKEGRSVEETARDWEGRHDDVPTSAAPSPRRETEDGQ